MSDRNVEVAAVFDEEGRVAHATKINLIGEPYSTRRSLPGNRSSSGRAATHRAGGRRRDASRLVLAVPLDMAPNVRQ